MQAISIRVKTSDICTNTHPQDEQQGKWRSNTSKGTCDISFYSHMARVFCVRQTITHTVRLDPQLSKSSLNWMSCKHETREQSQNCRRTIESIEAYLRVVEANPIVARSELLFPDLILPNHSSIVSILYSDIAVSTQYEARKRTWMRNCRQIVQSVQKRETHCVCACVI